MLAPQWYMLCVSYGLGQGRCARVAQRQGYGQTVQKAVLVPQLQFIEGRCFPSCRRGKSPWSCLFRKPYRLCSCSRSVGRCPCCAGRVPARCCARQRFRLCPLHPRFSTFLVYLVFMWGVTEVLCAVTDQGPRILLDFLCTSGGVSQLVPTSSGYTWISRELHAVHVMLVPSLGVGFFGRRGGHVHRHRAGGRHVHRDMASQN